MADYRSILDRAITGLAENDEESRRNIYDKARNALMRQLSSLEPALSPAEISKQRLSLEEAIRDTENKQSGADTLEEEVDEPLAEEAATIDNIPAAEPISYETAPQSIPEDKPIIEQSSTNADAEITANVSDSADIAAETESSEEAPPSVQKVTETEISASQPVVEVIEPETAKSPVDDIADVTVPDVKGQELVDEADAALARVDAIRNEDAPNALDELKKTMAEDGVPMVESPQVTIPKEDTTDHTTHDMAEDIPPSDIPAIAVEASRKSGGRGLLWVFVLLILVGMGVFGWAQREALGPVASPIIKQIQTAAADILGSFSSPEIPNSTDAKPNNEPVVSGKTEDRILDTPIKEPIDQAADSDNSTDSDNKEAPRIQLGNRVILPSETTTPEIPTAVPSPETSGGQTPAATPKPAEPAVPKDTTILTPPKAGDGTPPNAKTVQVTPITPQTLEESNTTPTANLFASSAILYEERQAGGRPDVSTGTVVWEAVSEGSQAIGSQGLPSVRGNARIQNRDIKVRFEIMRNLDESLPASHLIEMEFIAGPLFTDDSVNNIAGVLMKANEQDNGQQLTGAVVKVSDNVFWVAMSARAADLASNTDALKGQKWFDIPIIFKSGKRAILTLEKGLAGSKAIEQVFAAWESKS